jgi:hypothetical protein
MLLNHPALPAQYAVLINVVVNATLAWRGLEYPKTADARNRAHAVFSYGADAKNTSGEDEHALPAHKHIRARASAQSLRTAGGR